MHRPLALLALLGVLTACTSSSGPNNGGGGGGGSLTATNAAPASGNATFDNLMISHDTGAEGITGGIVIRATQSIGAHDHEISVYFDSLGVVETVQHQWTTGSPATLVGLAMCTSGGAACPGAGVAVDVAQQSITFTALVLPDPIGGATTSTLDGALTYP
ncbi:MAG: hypothetical protein IPJ57_18795 [Gemmatimonadetes bacterium]|nr:hypothetical protein [Gemmatimonadota bacterium]